MQEVIGPLLDTVQDVRVLGLKLKDDAVCTEFGLVGKMDSIAVIVVVVEEREQSIVELLSVLMCIEILILVQILGVGQLMQGQNMEPGDALIALHGKLDMFRLGDLLDGKVVADAPRTIPDEFVNRGQSLAAADEFVEEIVQSSSQSVGGANIRGELLIVAGGRASKTFDHSIF